jgi:xylulokinase
VTTEGLLAIDVGLTNVKAVVFGTSGDLIARAAIPYPTHRPTPDAVEQDPAAWWSAVTGAVCQLPAEVRERVVAMGVTAHMHALTALGRAGDPIGPALILGDRRAVRDAAEITRRVGADEIAAITGTDLDPSMPAAKALYLRRRDPDAWRSVTHLLACKDYLRYRLTGEIATEPIDACATSLYDIRSGRWSDPLLEATGVTRAMLPPVMSPWAVAGSLVRSAAQSLGLKAGTPVVVGAGDDVVVLGFGILDPGVALEHIGTTGSMMAVTEHPITDPEHGLELYPHVLPDRWVIGGSHTTAGAALAWASDLLGYGSVDAALATLATAPQPGLSFLPSLAGERFPARIPAARGAWVGLGLNVTRELLMRAAFEGVAVALGQVLERIEALVGRQDAVRVATAEDPRWLALRAAAYDRRLEVSHTNEPTALGLASLIAVATGAFPDVRTAVNVMAHIDRDVQPEPTRGPERFTTERLLRHAWDEAAAARMDVGSGSQIDTSRPAVQRLADPVTRS